MSNMYSNYNNYNDAYEDYENYECYPNYSNYEYDANDNYMNHNNCSNNSNDSCRLVKLFLTVTHTSISFKQILISMITFMKFVIQLDQLFRLAMEDMFTL